MHFFFPSPHFCSPDVNNCIPPTIPHAKYTSSLTGWYEDGYVIRITCDPGYSSKDWDATTQCVNGKWLSVPICQRKSLPFFFFPQWISFPILYITFKGLVLPRKHPGMRWPSSNSPRRNHQSGSSPGRVCFWYRNSVRMWRWLWCRRKRQKVNLLRRWSLVRPAVLQWVKGRRFVMWVLGQSWRDFYWSMDIFHSQTNNANSWWFDVDWRWDGACKWRYGHGQTDILKIDILSSKRGFWSYLVLTEASGPRN